MSWIPFSFKNLRKIYGGRCQYPECLEVEHLEFIYIGKDELKEIFKYREEKFYYIIMNRNLFMLLCRKHQEVIKGGYRERK